MNSHAEYLAAIARIDQICNQPEHAEELDTILASAEPWEDWIDRGGEG